MNYLYVTSLLGFDIKERLEKPVNFGNSLFITNEPKHFIGRIQPQQALSIGSLETSYLFHGNPVIYSIRPTANEAESRVEIINFMRDCLAFLQTLWLDKDNSINIELGFAISSDGMHVHSNSLSPHFWTCEGRKEKWSICPDKLREICESYEGRFAGMPVSFELEHTMQRKETGRVNVAVNFLQQARSTPDLGLRIANYCSFFEGLLSTTTVELSHQMAERSAFYLCVDPHERLSHYKLGKRAYAIRSKVVHGDVISKKDLPKLVALAKHCDDTARSLMFKFMEDDCFSTALASGGEKLDQFFLGKIFGIEAWEEEDV